MVTLYKDTYVPVNAERYLLFLKPSDRKARKQNSYDSLLQNLDLTHTFLTLRVLCWTSYKAVLEQT